MNNVIQYRTDCIYVTMKEVKTGLEKIREVGVDESFATAGTEDRVRFIDEWIEERGVPQHESELELLSFKFIGTIWNVGRDFPSERTPV